MYLLEYKSIYKEKAISVNDIIKNKNLCLLIYSKNIIKRVYLYDKNIIINKDENEIDINGIYAYGRIEIESDTPYKAYNTSYTAAVKGYGAFLYDTLLSLAGEKGLCPDRNVVSEDAESVWEYYFTKRRNEINVKPIDDIDDPITISKKDDGYVHHPDPLAIDFDNRHFIDYVYYFKNSEQHLSEIKVLQKRSKEFTNSLTYDNFLNDLEVRSIDFFIKQKQVRGREL